MGISCRVVGWVGRVPVFSRFVQSSRSHNFLSRLQTGHSELGDFYFSRGDLNAALRSYLRLRDYCSTSAHIVDMCMNVITVSIHMHNFAHVINYVSKAEQTPELSDQVIINKLRVCAALAYLDSRKFKQAAKKLLEVNYSSIHTKFGTIISTQDIAKYTTLCALAEFDRKEIKSRLIDNSDFRNFLETAPEMKEMIHDFYNSRYGPCLALLDRVKQDLLLDLHLSEHVASLYTKIRNKAIVQYFSPFVSVDLNVMAKAFNTDVPALEAELSSLIVEGVIQARIDSHNKRLIARQTDDRSATFERALSAGEQFHRDSKALLVRVNLIRSDFYIKAPRGQGGHGPQQMGPGMVMGLAGPDRKLQ
jgi:COP9 signalosome complex subunit 1